MGNKGLERLFPGLLRTNYEVTSPEACQYNCIAWAAADTSRWWAPDPFQQYFWPSKVVAGNSLRSYLEAFGPMGYAVCGNADLEPGFEKVIIY
jgi:hypothetical protein